MEKVCKNCAWWGVNPPEPGAKMSPNGRIRQCGSPNILRGYRVANDDVPEDSAVLEYDEGWGVMTGPLFGCNKFEGVI